MERSMSQEPSRKITLPRNLGLAGDLVNRFKLIVRLLGDKRVSTWIKLIPIASGLYFLIPDLVLGPLDDAAIIWLGLYLFVELCPPEVVDEHVKAIGGQASVTGGKGNEKAEDEIVEGEVIEGEFEDH